MYDFFQISQLFTQAMKYLNETGRGHMERPDLLTRNGLCLEHGFVICALLFSVSSHPSFSLKVNGGNLRESDTTNVHHTLFNSTHSHLVSPSIKGAIISISESL